MIKKLPNCKDRLGNLKSYNVTFEYETTRKNKKIETVESKGINASSAGANVLLWLIITNDIRKQHFKKKNINLINISKNSIQSNPL